MSSKVKKNVALKVADKTTSIWDDRSFQLLRGGDYTTENTQIATLPSMAA